MTLRVLVGLLIATINFSCDSKTITSVTLSPHLTELVFSAGGGDSLLGVSAYSDYPKQVNELPVIGDAFRLDYELIKSLNPNVVFYWKNGTAGQVVQQLQNLGLNLHEISINQLSDIPLAITDIAKTLNSTPIVPVEQFNQQLNALQVTDQKRTALIQLSAKPIYTVNDKHWMSEAIGVCGLENVFNDLEPLSAAVTLEAVVLKKPDYIITTGVMPNNPLTEWSSIPAVENQRIINLEPDHFSRPTLRTLLAIESLCKQLKLH